MGVARYHPPIKEPIMSWTVTINDLQNYKGFDASIIEQMLTQHLQYPADMELALDVARKAQLSTAVLSGGRTPNPYGDDEVVDISIRGMGHALDFNAAMRRNIMAGPDEEALAEQAKAKIVG